MSNEDIAVFSDSMSILPLVNISGSFDVAGKLVAISRSDNSVRAVATRLNMPIPPVPSWPFAGLLPFSFLLYGNVNDGIVHFVFQPSEPYLSMYVLDLVGPEVDFVPNADAGTYELPLVFRFFFAAIVHTERRNRPHYDYTHIMSGKRVSRRFV